MKLAAGVQINIRRRFAMGDLRAPTPDAAAALAGCPPAPGHIGIALYAFHRLGEGQLGVGKPADEEEGIGVMAAGIRGSVHQCESFPERAKAAGGGIVVGGSNYGQGSSREHAALVPLYLGVKAVAVKSFARIHKANLINSGILPLVFADPTDYDDIEQGDVLVLPNVRREIASGSDVTMLNKTKNRTYRLSCECSARQREMLLYGGLINMIKEKNNG